MNSKIAFVCTANYYRSRFAEHFFNWLAPQHGLRWHAESRGVLVGQWGNIGSISQATIARLASHGVQLPAVHREPLPLVSDDFSLFHRIICVKESEHRREVLRQFPQHGQRVEYWHVDDLDCATPDEALPELEEHVRALVARLSQAERSGRASASGQIQS